MLLAIFLLVMGSAFSQSIVKVDDQKQSFGEVKQGVVVELHYVLTNSGTEPLLIYNYDVQCSCTSVTFDAKPVLPGQSTTVTVKFDTKTVYERQDRIVTLHTNAKKGDVKLRFKGNVKRVK